MFPSCALEENQMEWNRQVTIWSVSCAKRARITVSNETYFHEIK